MHVRRLKSIVLLWLALGVLSVAFGAPSTAVSSVKECSKVGAKAWSKTELWTWRELCSDGDADLSDMPGGGMAPQPDKKATWKKSRSIRAKFLQDILTKSRYVSKLAKPQIRITGMWVKDDVNLANIKVIPAFDFLESRFEGNIYGSSSTFARDVDLSGSYITKKVDLSESTLNGDIYFELKAHAADVDLGWADVSGGVYMQTSSVAGEVSANDSTVGDSLSLSEGKFNKVNLQYARIGKSVSAYKSVINGKFDLNNVSVEKDSIYVNDARINDVELSFASVGTNVEFMRTRVLGEITMDSTSIGKNAIFSGGTFTKQLELYALDIGGRAIFRDQAKLTDVNLRQSHVGDEIDLTGAEIDGRVYFSQTVVDGPLNLAFFDQHAIWSESSFMSLSAMSVHDINDSEDSWPSALDLNGFMYERVDAPDSPDSGLLSRPRSWHERWLRRDGYYDRQSYKQLEAALRSSGRSRAADKIAILAEDRELERATIPARVFGFAYKYTVGYGYEPWRALAPAAIFILAGAILASRLNYDRQLAPSSLILSAQRFIPVLSFGESYAKVDLTSKDVPAVIRGYFYAHTVFGYVLVAFLLAAVSKLTSST